MANQLDELSGAPLADLIHAVAAAIADGQFRMDRASLRAAEYMSGRVLLRDEDSGRLLRADGAETLSPVLVDTRAYFGYDYDADGNRRANRLSMMELGFVPTFYQFVDTVIDMKLTLRLHRERSESGVPAAGDTAPGGGRGARSRTVVTTTPVDARYASGYNFDARMSSKVRTKLVPVPPPAILEQRIQALIADERQQADREEAAAAERETRSLTAEPLGGPKFDGDVFVTRAGGPAASCAAGPFGVEAWVRFEQAEAGTIGVVGCSGADPAVTPAGWLLGAVDQRFALMLHLDAVAAPPAIVAARDSIALDRWQHLALSCDGREIRLYVDGRLRGGAPCPSNWIRVPRSAVLAIGSAPFAGRIDEVRVWGRALDAAEIRDRMACRLRGTEPGLLGCWRSDRAGSDRIPDITANGDHADRPRELVL